MKIHPLMVVTLLAIVSDSRADASGRRRRVGPSASELLSHGCQVALETTIMTSAHYFSFDGQGSQVMELEWIPEW